MAEEIRYFDSKSLTSAISMVKAHDPFILNTFFKRKEQHPADKIDVEIRTNTDQIARFVSPNGEAALIGERQKTQTKTVTLPRTYEKKIFTAYELAKFKQLGNVYISNASDRIAASNAMIIQELEDLKQRVYRRREQMACEALVTGKLTVAQDNLDFTIDYGFTSAQLVTLATGSKWSTAGIKPKNDITKWQRQIQKLAGINADIMIVGSAVADLLTSDDSIMKQLDNSYYKVGSLDLTSAYGTSGRYLGMLYGLQVYEYTQQYTNESKVSVNMMPENQVVLASTAATNAFKTHYGPAYRINNDQGLSVITSELLVEAKVNDDKTALTWSVEQKSLPTIHIPETIVSAVVM